MSWIKTIGPRDPEATPELAAAYQAAGVNRPAEYGGTGGPSNIIRSHSLDPELLKTAFQAGMHLINGPSPLSRRDREMIATVVSAANRCFY
jgi:alkylhydroperoxidase family enzyme